MKIVYISPPVEKRQPFEICLDYSVKIGTLGQDQQLIT